MGGVWAREKLGDYQIVGIGRKLSERVKALEYARTLRGMVGRGLTLHYFNWSVWCGKVCGIDRQFLDWMIFT
jgi:hypothetical protein